MTNTPEQEMRLHVYAALPRPAVPYNIKAALKILNPKPADKEQCLEHIKAAFEVVEHASRFMTPRSANIRDAVAELLKALKKAKIAKAKLAKLNSVIASYFEITCNIEAGIADCKNELEFYPARLPKSGPPHHRQQLAVEIAYDLVRVWLVQKHDIDQATSVSKNNEWHRLSAILNGKPVALRHMSHYRKSDQHSWDTGPQGRLTQLATVGRYQNLTKPSRKQGSK